MKLVATDYGWLVSIDDCRVQRIEVDFRLGFLMSDKSGPASAHIETPCQLGGEGSDVTLTPADAPTLCPILSLFNVEVTGIYIRTTGQLTMAFGNGRSLVVEPDESYEAWQIACPGEFLIVCPPGGLVCVYRETEENRQGPISAGK